MPDFVDRPTQPGWYWYRLNEQDVWDIIQALESRHPSISGTVNYIRHHADHEPIAVPAGQFYGPLWSPPPGAVGAATPFEENLRRSLGQVGEKQWLAEIERQTNRADAATEKLNRAIGRIRQLSDDLED